LRGRLDAGLLEDVDDASGHGFRLSLTVDFVKPTVAIFAPIWPQRPPTEGVVSSAGRRSDVSLG
jgi:hypothetical protein